MLDESLLADGIVYAIAIIENYSRAVLASSVTRRQDLNAFLAVLYRAVQEYGPPEAFVTDSGSGSIFLANRAQAIYRALHPEELSRRDLSLMPSGRRSEPKKHFGLLLEAEDCKRFFLAVEVHGERLRPASFAFVLVPDDQPVSGGLPRYWAYWGYRVSHVLCHTSSSLSLVGRVPTSREKSGEERSRGKEDRVQHSS